MFIWEELKEGENRGLIPNLRDSERSGEKLW